MFIRPNLSETALICRGIAALLIAVTLGVSLAENQLNNLMQCNEFVQAVNIKRDVTGRYSFYLLGTEYSIRAVYNVARFSNNEHEAVLEVGNGTVVWPKDRKLSDIQAAYKLWRQQFLDEALRFKKTFEVYLKELKQITVYYIELLWRALR